MWPGAMGRNEEIFSIVIKCQLVDGECLLDTRSRHPIGWVPTCIRIVKQNKKHKRPTHKSASDKHRAEPMSLELEIRQRLRLHNACTTY